MKYPNSLRSILLVLAAFFVLSAAETALGQYKGLPVKKEKLLNVLRSRQLQSREIVAVIKSNGVDFRVTGPVEQELFSAGARPEVIAAAKANYRGPGGKAPAPTGDDDDFNTQRTVSDLERRVRSNPKGYLSYQQLGYQYLLAKNYVEAEKYMREAMTRGGSAVFPVLHDHNGTFTAGCTGTIYVTTGGVQFESNTEVSDTFGIPDSSIKKISMNSGLLNVFRAKSGSFQVKLDGRNYNFAPVSGNSTESKLLIKLVGK